jgi:hypothetical protein
MCSQYSTTITRPQVLSEKERYCGHLYNGSRYTGTYHGAEGEGWKYGYMIARRSWESTSVRVREENGDNVIEIQI